MAISVELLVSLTDISARIPSLLFIVGDLREGILPLDVALHSLCKPSAKLNRLLFLSYTI